MKINKKMLTSLCVISGILLISSVVFADSFKESLTVYLQDSSIDICGREFDRILFKNINNVSIKGYGDKEILEKIKFMIDDVKTIPLQTKCMWKIINQKQNTMIYGSITGLVGLKASVGAEEFNKLMIKLFSLILK